MLFFLVFSKIIWHGERIQKGETFRVTEGMVVTALIAQLGPIVPTSPLVAFLVGLVTGLILGTAFGLWLGKNIGYNPTVSKFVLAAGLLPCPQVEDFLDGIIKWP